MAVSKNLLAAESTSSSIEKLSFSNAMSGSSFVGVVDPSTVVKGAMTDNRDNQIYKTVTIVSQTWMAKKLNYNYSGVDFEYDVYTGDSTCWCYFNREDFCAKYGLVHMVCDNGLRRSSLL